MSKEKFIDVFGDGEYVFSKLRVTKHGYEAKTKKGWIPISESIYDESDAADVPTIEGR
jgi:hypothetical protein